MNDFGQTPNASFSAFAAGDTESPGGFNYFQQVLEYSLDMICTIDATGRFITMSKAAEKILGYAANEIIGLEFTKLVHPDDVDSSNAKAAQVMTGKDSVLFVNRFRRNDGNFIYVEWSAVWAEENQLIYCIGRDITAIQMRMLKTEANEKKLSDSEYFLNKVGKLARVGGWEFDVEQQLSRWSQAVYDIYEVPYDYDPNLDDGLKFYAPYYREKIEHALKLAYENGASWDLELELSTVKGNNIWVRSYGEAVYKNGKIIKLHGVFMDINKYHNNEAVLSRSLDLLTQHNRQLKSFTHILSHNLRNHANNIAMLTSFIDTDLLDKENAELVTKLDKVSKNLNNTLDHLSDAIKIREQVIAPDNINLKEVANEVLNLLDGDIKFSYAEVITDFMVPKLSFPRIYMESILSNLISNSIKYKKTNEHPEIIISCYFDEDAECVVLEYQDNGIGIDLLTNGDKVFGLYKTFTAGPDSHGVGLFLVKTQVESQGGRINIESKPGVGTKFRIFFKPGTH
jgi:PAS domain S-box-containing protein